jgi:hypothetical protein
MFAVLEGINDQDPDELAHCIGGLGRSQFELTHRERESVFDWNGEPKLLFVVVVHDPDLPLQKGNAARPADGFLRFAEWRRIGVSDDS